jgi:ethanolamine utilization protein EutA
MSHTHSSEHSHDHDHGHNHGEEDHQANSGAIFNPDWLTLKSVGVDIGSSTSHLMFSELTLERQGKDLTSKYIVVGREVVYRSPIILTPFRDSETIDVIALSKFIHDSYKESGFEPSTIDTGAVICTGEAVKKKNSEAITRLFSSEGGKFVCATAGAHLEGILAAHGSGAVARSISRNQTIMNVDIGGGTSKVTIVKRGKIVETGAINVGARLIAWNDQGILTRIEQPAMRVADSLCISLALGQKVSEEVRRQLSQKLCDILFEYLERGNLSDLAKSLLITEPLECKELIDEILFSGGVSEYVYGTETSEYGDLGPVFGSEVRKRLESLGIKLGDATERIRATVIGASQYTIQVSSSTIFVSNQNILPLRDRQVVVANYPDGQKLSPEIVASEIRQALVRLDLDDDEAGKKDGVAAKAMAIFMNWPMDSNYDSLHAIAKGISIALSGKTAGAPITLIFSQDIGGMVGHILKQELEIPEEVVVIDEIDVGDLDFVDVGQVLPSRNAIPVVIKSLIFE